MFLLFLMFDDLRIFFLLIKVMCIYIAKFLESAEKDKEKITHTLTPPPPSNPEVTFGLFLSSFS